MEASAGKCKAGYHVEPYYSLSCRYLQDESRSVVCWPVGWRPKDADALHAAATVPSGCKGGPQAVPSWASWQASRGGHLCCGLCCCLVDVPAVLTAETCNWKANMCCLLLPAHAPQRTIARESPVHRQLLPAHTHTPNTPKGTGEYTAAHYACQTQGLEIKLRERQLATACLKATMDMTFGASALDLAVSMSSSGKEVFSTVRRSALMLKVAK